MGGGEVGEVGGGNFMWGVSECELRKGGKERVREMG